MMFTNTNGQSIITRNIFFTLVELLVVIATISILVSVLLPALSKAKETVYRSSCLSSMRQIGAAFNMYIGDNCEFYPPFQFEGVASVTWNWAYGLKASNYISNSRIYKCEASKRQLTNEYTNGPEDCTAKPNVASRYTTIAYGYNYYWIGGNYGESSDSNELYKSTKLSRIKSPTETILLADSWRKPLDKGINVIVDHLEPIEGPVIHDRHLNGANILWIDGHVKFFPSAYSMLMSEKTFFDRD